MAIISVTDIDTIRGKRVFLRVDFNIPIANGIISDTFRIDHALPTISFLLEAGAKIILGTHLGEDGRENIAPVAEYLSKKIPVSVISTLDQEEIKKSVSLMKDGEVLILPNLRAFPGEKENKGEFAAFLASLADIYVNDAFSVSHREHASIVGVPKLLPHFAGLQMQKEIESLSYILHTPPSPFVVILGGAKLHTKLPLIKQFLRTADTVIVGGALLNQVLYEQGKEIGHSLHEEDPVSLEIFAKKNIYLPKQVVVSRDGDVVQVSVDAVEREDMIVDIGGESVEEMKAILREAKTVLWNGPMGKYEQGFGGATEDLINFLAKNSAKTVIGGGDTATLVHKLGLENKVFFVSTGGGATLDYLLDGTLPGITALEM